MEEERELFPEEMLQRSKIQGELYELYAEEENLWYQKARGKWLLEGDQNTTYFHRIANGRKRKNIVYSLEKDGGIIEGTKDLLKHATEYYKELFGPAPGNMFQMSLDLWTPNEKLNAQDNEDLTRDFTEEEVKIALFSMKCNKAPGPDNIPVEFYQH